MHSFYNMNRKLTTLLLAALLSACGGGGGGDGGGTTTPPVNTPPVITPPTSGVPVATGDTATDGYNWFNYRRAGIGLTMLSRNSVLDTVATGHSNYLRLNNTVSHDQVQGNPGFTGVHLADRFATAGYTLAAPYAYGEVISAAGDRSGFYHAEELIAAIYHRFVVFEPMFKEMGTGASTSGSGYTYFTADLIGNNGLGTGLGRGQFVVYPSDGQTQVPTSFDSDTESPDPVPNLNTVGYPVSVHANITRDSTGATPVIITVTSFTISPRNGAPMTTRLLSSATDQHTSAHEAAIIPLTTLSSNTTYDVSFSGTVDGVAATKNWSFTTK